MAHSLRGIVAALGLSKLLRSRRQRLLLKPPLERRQPEVAAENYAARHLLEHTLDRKADLRRLVPASREAALRYRELLGYELEGLKEMNQAMRTAIGGRDLIDFLRETGQEIDRLQIEIAWCEAILARHALLPA